MAGRDAAEQNRAVFGDRAIVAGYDREGWLCTGERELVRRLAGMVRGQPLLDVGVGAGRTTGLLCLISDDYLGVDYAPEMVSTARHRHPYADLREGDARSLNMCADNSFAAALFSYNGIDNLDHDDRSQALAELRRVLRPGGLLCYSTLNRDSPGFPARPWRDLPRPALSPRPLLRFAVALCRRVIGVPSWWRGRRLEQDHGEWAMGTLAIHGYRLVNHFITVPAASREARAAGFELLEMLSPEGEALNPEQRRSDLDMMFVLARKHEQAPG